MEGQTLSPGNPRESGNTAPAKNILNAAESVSPPTSDIGWSSDDSFREADCHPGIQKEFFGPLVPVQEVGMEVLAPFQGIRSQGDGVPRERKVLASLD